MPGNSNLHDSAKNKQDEFYTRLQLIEDELKHYRAHFKGKRVPCDYEGAIGVPITFMQYHKPDQFEILGATESEGVGFSAGLWNADSGIAQPMMNGGKKYKRIFIRRRREGVV